MLYANDTVDELLNKKINQGLSSLGEQISNLIPGEGDTEVTISEQDNYDIKFSLLAVRALAHKPYSSLQMNIYILLKSELVIMSLLQTAMKEQY